MQLRNTDLEINHKSVSDLPVPVPSLSLTVRHGPGPPEAAGHALENSNSNCYYPLRGSLGNRAGTAYGGLSSWGCGQQKSPPAWLGCPHAPSAPADLHENPDWVSCPGTCTNPVHSTERTQMRTVVQILRVEAPLRAGLSGSRTWVGLSNFPTLPGPPPSTIATELTAGLAQTPASSILPAIQLRFPPTCPDPNLPST